MVEVVGLSIGLLAVLVMVALHFSPGTERIIPDDISQDVLEHRTESVPETGFPEPMNRSIGGGAVPGSAVGGGGEADGELAEGEAEEAEPSPAEIPDDEADTFEIEYAKEGETIEVKENEPLLDAGEDEGWDLPYACRQGQCVSCGGQVTDGPAEEYLTHDGQEMLSEDELGDGYTLTCVAYPTADLTLETSETP
jgi:2Fe-2S type ferredoxin